MSVIENPWRYFDNYDPASFAGKESEPVQWPIKLWRASVVSPYFHKANLLIAADCSAFAYAKFHSVYAAGKVPLICCPATDFDIASRLGDILRHNDVRSVTVVRMEARCCADLTESVMEAVRYSRLPIPVQFTTLLIPGENLEEDDVVVSANIRKQRG